MGHCRFRNWRKLASFTYHAGTHRVHQATGSDGQVTTLLYNSTGQIETVADPTGTTKFIYDRTPQTAPSGPFDGIGYLMRVQRKPVGAADSAYVTVTQNTAFDIFNRATTTDDADGYTLQFISTRSTAYEGHLSRPRSGGNQLRGIHLSTTRARSSWTSGPTGTGRESSPTTLTMATANWSPSTIQRTPPT